MSTTKITSALLCKTFCQYSLALSLSLSFSFSQALSTVAADLPEPSPVPLVRPVTGASSSSPLQAGTGSTTLQAGTGSTTLQAGTGSTTLQAGTGSTLIQAGTGSSTLQMGVKREAGPVNILFIVDGSRSMLEVIEHGGRQKMDAAKDVLQQALSRIPNDVNIGLRVFGQGAVTSQHSMVGGGFGGLNLFSECQNSALWVPIGRSNRRSFIEKVRQIKPYGMTPLSYAIEQAAHYDFRGVEGSKVIILITDGADTCDRNPCEVIARLPLHGIRLKVDVVGLALAREPEARRQLDCIAKTSNGKYYDAKSSAELINSISASVSKAIEGRVIIKPGSGSVEPGSGASINTETPIEMVPIEPMKSLDK